jgi:hypothetical protein
MEIFDEVLFINQKYIKNGQVKNYEKYLKKISEISHKV